MPNGRKDIKGAEVEKFRLTKEQLDFQRKFKNLQKIRELLQARSLGLSLEMQTNQDLWEQLQMQLQTLEPPRQPLEELPGMNFAPEEGERPAWNLKY